MAEIYATALGPNNGKLKLAGNVISLAYVRMDPQLNIFSPVLLTGITITQSANVQYVQSLEKFIYIYSFGENMGKVTVEGLGFWEWCGLGVSGSVGGVSGGAGTGLGGGIAGAAAGSIAAQTLSPPAPNAVMQYYGEHSISKGQSKKITIGSLFIKEEITGFLDAFEIVTADPSIEMVKFKLQFSAMPVQGKNNVLSGVGSALGSAVASPFGFS